MYVIVFILLKGGFEVCGFKLMLDKMEYLFGFLCDGLGRGGMCDIFVWDFFYLVIFWMFNSNIWISFYFYYKYFIFC